jgi:integrase
VPRPLTAAFVTHVRTPGRYPDGGGLYLQVKNSGAKSWVFRYERGGRERAMGLGPIRSVPLVSAREKAFEARRLLRQGADPLIARRAETARDRMAALNAVSFADCAARYIDNQRPGWSQSWAAEWTGTLERYAYPVFGITPVAEVGTVHILRALEAIWVHKPDTARRLRRRIEAVLDWARAMGYREGPNPARWSDHLKNLVPKREKASRVRHHAALAYADIPEFMAELRALDRNDARALEFLILTAARLSEVRLARWAEIDQSGRLWTIPAERMKAGKGHRVPLSKPAVELLQRVPQHMGQDLIFPGARGGVMHPNAMWLVVREDVCRRGVTVHGFRSTFRDWAAETTAYPNHVQEMALAHGIGSAVEKAYRRGDLFEKRRRLMEDWGKFCGSPAAEADVVPIRREAAE